MSKWGVSKTMWGDWIAYHFDTREFEYFSTWAEAMDWAFKEANRV